MGNFAENLNLGNRFRPPLLYHKSKATGLYFELMNKIIKNIKLHHTLQNVQFEKMKWRPFDFKINQKVSISSFQNQKKCWKIFTSSFCNTWE